MIADAILKVAGLPQEAAERAAVGRYYYAVLLSVRLFLDAAFPPKVDRGAEAHAAVLSRLRTITLPHAVLLSADLQALRTLRNRVEYGEETTDTTLSAQTAQAACRKALKLLAALEAATPAPASGAPKA